MIQFLFYFFFFGIVGMLDNKIVNFLWSAFLTFQGTFHTLSINPSEKKVRWKDSKIWKNYGVQICDASNWSILGGNPNTFRLREFSLKAICLISVLWNSVSIKWRQKILNRHNPFTQIDQKSNKSSNFSFSKQISP